jgi:diadenosine tetraphosphatase ApaH/serine/threonine PP2A family protein phosphatase
MTSIKSLLLLFPRTSYGARRYNQRLRREIEEHPDRALMVWERENSSQLWYVFHGMAGALQMQPLTVLRETGLIHTNLILLKDYYRFCYHAGLNREITDVDAIIARLRRCREELPHVRQTFCFGTSVGGYAAILFGHYLQVDVVCAFGPATLINLDVLKKFGGCKDVWRITEQHRDLARLLAKHNGRTRYKIFYCDGYGTDRTYAEHLQGLPGVELYPQPGNTHNVVQAMYESGRLREIFDTAPGATIK